MSRVHARIRSAAAHCVAAATVEIEAAGLRSIGLRSYDLGAIGTVAIGLGVLGSSACSDSGARSDTPTTAQTPSMAPAERTDSHRSTPPPAAGFQARLEFPTAHDALAKPAGLLAGDLDGDGRDELVVSTRSPGGVEVWSGLAPSLGSVPAVRVFASGDYPLGPVWFGPRPRRGSERALVAIASRETLVLSVLDLRAALRAKDAAAAPAVWRAELPARPRVLASGELREEGAPDGTAVPPTLAVITIEDELLLYSGSESPRRIPLPREHATCARISSDGSRIAIGFQGSRRLALHDAEGSARKVVDLPGLPRDLAEVDLDGDGDGELLVAAGEKSVLVYGLGRPGGATAWLDERPLDVEVGTIPVRILHGEIGGSGREESFVVDLQSQDVRTLGWRGGRKGGTGASFLSISSAYAGQRPSDGALGDFDGDGALDLAIENPDARRVSLFFGARVGTDGGGARFESETRVPCDRAPHSIAAGDLDGDGRPEVLVLAGAEGTLSLLRNDSGERGGLAAGERLFDTGDAEAVACADLDGDGRCDAAWLGLGAQESLLEAAFGDGSGRLSRRVGFQPLRVGRRASDLLLADVDGDGRADAVVAEAESDRVWLLRDFARTRPAGAPSEVQADEMTCDAPSGPCALALLRRAGASEIALALGGPGPRRGVAILVARVNSEGRFALEERSFQPTPLFPRALAAGDLDGDGREDLAVLATEAGGDSQGFVIPWLSAEDGSWRALEPMKTGARPYRVAAGDLDGDGRAEILVTAQNSHHVEVWLARAAGFLRVPDLGAGTGPLDLALVDLDGDGRPEIVVANAFSDDVSVIRLR